MDIAEFTQLLEDFNYLLARIRRYLKNNQYVYLRAFHSWQESFNLAAERLNTDGALPVPKFNLTPADFSVSGKSIKPECVEKFVSTVRHQAGLVDDHIRHLATAGADRLARSSPLERFFHHDSAGQPVEPPAAEKRIFVAIPPGETALHIFWQGIQPALETHGLSFFLANRAVLDDASLCILCQELHTSRLAICNLAGQAANVMLALGLAYGTGKPVIILQDQDGVALGALANHGFVSYRAPTDLKTALAIQLANHLRD